MPSRPATRSPRKILVRVGLGALATLVLWTALVLVGTLQGWWRQPLAAPGDADAFARELEDLADAGNRGNLVLVLIEGGEPRLEHGVSIGEPVDVDTLFQLASLSKWITAWGVMSLVEQGRIDLDAPVSRYLTRFQLPASEFDPDGVTVRRLLSHTAGLTDGLGYRGFAPGEEVQSLEESLTRAADASPGASGVTRVGIEPGSRWLYSGGGFTLLQLIVEEVSGQDFETYMQQAVLVPLGMRDSTFHWTPASGTRLAVFYDTNATPAPHFRFTALAAASLYSSARDLTRFLKAQLPGPDGAPPGRGVLSPATLEAMRTPHAWRLGAPIWGLGTILYAPDGRGGFVIGHDGNNGPAINTAARLDPATGDGIVVLETGAPLLATTLASEWTFWETGRPDILSLVIDSGETFRSWVLGALAIVVGAALTAWRYRRPRDEEEALSGP
jgi:CubicO group peptidase (beta-lactamase class C family)